MSIQPYNDLIPLYSTLCQGVESSQTNGGIQLEQKVNALSSYIHKNAKALSKDLSNDETHEILYTEMANTILHLNVEQTIQTRLVKEIKAVQYKSELFKLEALAKNPDKLILWLNENQSTLDLSKEDVSSSPLKVLDAFDEVKKSLKSSENCKSAFDQTLSKMVVSCLSLGNKNGVQLGVLLKNNEIDVRTLAHVVNAKKIALKDLQLPIESLNTLAPYLHYVNCQHIDFKDENEAQNFIENCSNTYEIFIDSDKIKEIKKLPAGLEKLNCSYCSSLTTLSLSNLEALKIIECCDCTSLTTLSLSDLQALEELYCSSCTSLTTPSLSDLEALKIIECRDCTSLTTLSFSNLQALEELSCRGCVSLTTLSLSNLQALETLYCCRCISLRTLSLSNLEGLKTIKCDNCLNLTSLGDSLPNTLQELYCQNCFSLAQLPQVPPTATVYSGNSRCGNLNRFNVNPSEIEQKPMELLLRLGNILLQNKPFPNIVYIDPLTGQQDKGIDAGGLRRQFIYDLSQRLFKNPLEFPFITSPGTTTGHFPTLADPENNQQILALRTLARLIALSASSTALITGPILSQSFYNAVLLLAKDPKLNTFKIPLTEAQKEELYLIAEYGYKAENKVPDNEKQFFAIGDPIALIAHELKAVLQQNLDKVTLNDFIAKVEGVDVKSEMLLGMISEGRPRIKFDIATAPQIKGFLEAFIKKFDNTSTLKDFVKFVAGSSSLGVDEEIKVYILRNSSIQHFPITHTCFQSIEFPPYTTYEAFEEKLLRSLEAKDTFRLQ